MKRLTSRKGAAATELAIMLPVLIVLCLAGIDMGRHAQTAMTLANAARVGTEWGSGRRVTSYTYSSWEADVKAIVLEELANTPDFNASDATITVTKTSSTYVTPVIKVEVSYPFKTIVSWPFIPQSLTLTRQVAMCEYR